VRIIDKSFTFSVCFYFGFEYVFKTVAFIRFIKSKEIRFKIIPINFWGSSTKLILFL